jgi:predicted nuclease of predicted toxin-antitoxin system
VTPARLLLDEMLTPTIARQLRERGHDVSAITERPHLVSLPDDQVLAVAEAEGRVVVTANIGDFATLDTKWAASGREHGGIVLVTTSAFPQDRSFIGAVVKALNAAAQEGKLPGRGQARYLLRQP